MVVESGKWETGPFTGLSSRFGGLESCALPVLSFDELAAILITNTDAGSIFAIDAIGRQAGPSLVKVHWRIPEKFTITGVNCLCEDYGRRR